MANTESATYKHISTTSLRRQSQYYDSSCSMPLKSRQEHHPLNPSRSTSLLAALPKSPRTNCLNVPFGQQHAASILCLNYCNTGCQTNIVLLFMLGGWARKATTISSMMLDTRLVCSSQLTILTFQNIPCWNDLKEKELNSIA